MNLKDIMKALGKKNISTSMKYDKSKDLCFLDLETDAKSHLHLYEDSIIRGRYEYERSIDLRQDEYELIQELCSEFNDALHGRGYYQSEWGTLCEEYGIRLEVYS